MAQSTEAPIVKKAKRKHPAEHLLNLPKLKYKGTLPPARRRMEREGSTPGGVVLTSIKSLSQKDLPNRDIDRWRQEVDLQTKHMNCTCPHFEYRFAKYDPTLDQPQFICKHLERTLEGCERRGEVNLTWEGSKISHVEVTGFSFDEALIMRNIEAGANLGDPAAQIDEYDAEHAEYLSHLESHETEYFDAPTSDPFDYDPFDEPYQA